MGPFTQPPFPHMYVSGVGIVPKRNVKLRGYHDLSSPDGESVNDGIFREDLSPEYATVDMAISHIMAVGPGAYLTKVDVRNAFWLCPVRPPTGSSWAFAGRSINIMTVYFHLDSGPHRTFSTSFPMASNGSCKTQVTYHVSNITSMTSLTLRPPTRPRPNITTT